MNRGQNKLDDASRAGLRLLAASIERNAEKVAKRYRNSETRIWCKTIAETAAAIRKYADGGAPITLQILQQVELFDYHLTDKAYAEVE